MIRIHNGNVIMDEKQVGIAKGRTYYTDRHLDKGHFFQIYQGFGISAQLAKWLLNRRFEFVVINYYGKKKRRYMCQIERYVRRGKRYDNDGDMQYVLPAKEMEEI